MFQFFISLVKNLLFEYLKWLILNVFCTVVFRTIYLKSPTRFKGTDLLIFCGRGERLKRERMVVFAEQKCLHVLKRIMRNSLMEGSPTSVRLLGDSWRYPPARAKGIHIRGWSIHSGHLYPREESQRILGCLVQEDGSWDT